MPWTLPSTRRAVLGGLAITLSGFGDRGRARSAEQPPGPGPEPDSPRILTAAPAKVRLRPEPARETEVWAFNGETSGPVIRLRHGEELVLRLANDTSKPLSLHWHGLRGPNAMDGVGGLTQEPVPPGQGFLYRFTLPDPGTFLFRPLVISGSSEPAGRGLAGLLVVEEREPPVVDREVSLMVDDWRLEDDGSMAPFGQPLEAASSGRLGNLLAVNTAPAPQAIEVAPGTRLRLRMANACNARVMRIRFEGLKAYVAAIDSQPTGSFEPLRSTLPFSPGSRYDIVVDMPEEAGAKGVIEAMLGQGIPLVTLSTVGEPAGAKHGPVAPLPENRLLPPEIRLQNALRKEVMIAGGASLGPGGTLTFTGDPGRIWTLNGVSGSAKGEPLFRVKRGSPVALSITNRTPFPQPIHLHGHAFRLLHARDDGWEPYWLDTLLVPENRTVLIAFLADNPGRWALSSTVLERFDTGLWTWFEVT